MHKNIDRIINIPRYEVDIFKKTDSNSTYGELTKHGAIQLMKQIPSKKYNTFCDLGSGIGVVIDYITDLTNNFDKYIGIELSEERFKQSNILLDKKLKSQNYNIELLNDNILDTDVSKIDVIYISNLCFNHNFNIQLGKKLNEEVKCHCLIFANQDFRISRDHIKTVFGINQSWGKYTQMFKYEIMDD